MLSARNIADEQIRFDELRLISETDFAREHARTSVAPGDVLLTVVGTIGRTAVVPAGTQPFSLQRSVAVLKPEDVDSRYLAYALNTPALQQWLVEHAQGTAQKGVYLQTLRAAPIPVAPRREQLRIVDQLDELLSHLHAGRAELAAAQRKLQLYRQALLKAAVEGALTARWRTDRALGGPAPESASQLLERVLADRRARWEADQLARLQARSSAVPKDWQQSYPQPLPPDTAARPALPEGWTWATLDQLAVAQKYGTSARTNADRGGIPVLRMGNIQDGELDLRDLRYLASEHHEFPDLLLADGDLLFNRTNSRELVGKAAVYRTGLARLSPCSYASYLIAVRFSKRFLPEFAASYLNSGFGRKWVRSVATQQVGQANISGAKLQALTIPLPPLAEQTEIVRKLRELLAETNQQADRIARGLAQSVVQRKLVLAAAFSGQLAGGASGEESDRALATQSGPEARP